MSVINRMLRDLDARQQQERQASYTPAAQAPKSWPWGLFLIAAVAVVLIASLLLWQWPSEKPPSAQALTPMPALSDVAEVAPAKAQERPAVKVEDATLEAPPVVAEASTETVAPVTTATAEEMPSDASATETRGNDEAVIAEVTAQQHAVAQTEPVETAATPPPTSEAAGSMQVERVELSASELAAVKLKQAREALQRGQRERAGSLFEQVIALTPGHVEARSELAAYWYGRGQIASALAVLEQGLREQPQQSRWQLLYARILLEGGGYQEVVRALAQFDQTAPEARDLLQLRATAANALRQFSSAARDYQDLAQRAQQGRWWLAAAVAYEDAGLAEEAMRSYRQALQQNDLNQDAQRYAQQRLEVLGEQ